MNPAPRAVSSLTVRESKTWRNAVFVIFVLSGLALSSWVARVPSVRDDLHLSTLEIGLVMFAASIGSIVGLVIAPPVLAWYGPRRGMASMQLLVAFGMVLIAVGVSALASIPLVVVGLAFLGIGNGGCDVMMNVDAAAAEKAYGKTIMPLMHACFSIGTVAGAGIGALAAAVHLPVTVHLIAMAVILAASVLIAVRYIPVRTEAGPEGVPTDTDAIDFGTASEAGGGRMHAGSGAGSSRGLRARLLARLEVWRDARLMLIGVVMLGMAFAEGAANDWIALATVDGHHQSNAAGAVFLGIFVAAMTVGRMLGGPLIDRYGRVIAVRLTAVCGVAGLLTFIVSGTPWVAVLGAAFWGLGASLGFPIGMSAAADDSRNAAARVSAVSMIGYCSFLVGPPLLGFLGQHFGILNALYVILGLIAVSGLCAAAVRKQH